MIISYNSKYSENKQLSHRTVTVLRSSQVCVHNTAWSVLRSGIKYYSVVIYQNTLSDIINLLHYQSENPQIEHLQTI